MAFGHPDCMVIYSVGGKKDFVGWICVYDIPRVGETIRFSEERLGHIDWRVIDVYHSVGDGDERSVKQEVTIYVLP
jgi:hypothetical protein